MQMAGMHGMPGMPMMGMPGMSGMPGMQHPGMMHPNMPMSNIGMPGIAMPTMPPGMPPAPLPGAPPLPAAPPPGGDFNAPIYDLQQIGDVYTGPGAKCSTLPAILGGSLPRLSSEQADAVARAKKYAMEQSIKMVLMKQTLAHQQQQMASQRTQVQRQQALALMCRVYVGSISFELKEDTIRQAFLPFGPIKSINMSWDPVTQKHKGFAFVEYEIPEAAQLSLEQMNGVMLGGRNIKVVGRPSNMPQAQAVIDEIQEEAKQYNRIYVASVHPELSEDDIKNVFEAFGPVTYCRLAHGAQATRHKGYGFLEYATLNAALEAIASMNLFDLGGQYLRVGRAITPPHALAGPPPPQAMPTAAAVAAAAATAKIQAMDAVASNAVALGLTKLNALGVPPAAALPTLAAALPGALPANLPVTLPAALPAALPVTLPTALPVTLPAALPAALPPPGVVIPPPPVSARPQPPPQTQPPPVSAASAAATGEAGLQAALQKKLLDSSPDTLQQQESLSISGQSARHLVMQRLMRRRVSRTVLLANMVAPEEVDEALHHEIQEECGKWGAVERLVIYNERQSEDDDPAHALVKIFVQFQNPDEAAAAAAALNGRYFGGRTVRAALYDQELFDHGDLSG
ncbi:poly(U)-binding-splicing factor half pint isoform X2 [Cydia fagiglandana]|uniref:poly(U)-binding-splicing factor half pint isoform X2 n=1 Tax=Cydia fagiglandana TaxID=1458189 RepID=UPI002FEE0AF0